ncbi:hypothetical protein GYMLUDRAFT_488155 [Collybiopsis luxurians FD-317 M1]|uniref:Uncharacterized protein n=1 Tax=Collybiopsis luxurians FD-317 M1 TaxID=944289 RepID=A0A0D0C3H9_9AGAR|nr:hypothetical protein GYMLUDRAFT_488155 [Collybiopsis luxurians FD-317 M1]
MASIDSSVLHKILIPQLIVIMLDILFYGVHITIFGIYIYLQFQQQARQRFYQVSIMLLFLLSTTAVALATVHFVTINLEALGEETIPRDILDIIEVALRGLYIVANIIADILLIYRCYILWAKRKWVIAGPIILSATSTGLAIADVILEGHLIQNSLAAPKPGKTVSLANVIFRTWNIFEAFLGVNLLTNLILTGLIAGRLWWMSHTTRKDLGDNLSDGRSMKNVTAMVIESGLLYPLALIPCMAIQLSYEEWYSGFMPLVEPPLTIIVGIAPTLIMVRVDLGIIIQANSSTSSDLQHQSVHNLTQPLVPPNPKNFETSLPLLPPQVQADQDEKGHVILTFSEPNQLLQKYGAGDTREYEQ